MKHRETLHIAGVSHAAPIPAGARVGNVIFSSGISGRDPENGELPESPAAQARFAFVNLQSLLAGAGASLGDVGHVKVHLRDRAAYRPFVDEQWVTCFPDETDRPARHTVETNLPGRLLLQLEIIAVLADSA